MDPRGCTVRYESDARQEVASFPELARLIRCATSPHPLRLATAPMRQRSWAHAEIGRVQLAMRMRAQRVAQSDAACAPSHGVHRGQALQRGKRCTTQAVLCTRGMACRLAMPCSSPAASQHHSSHLAVASSLVPGGQHAPGSQPADPAGCIAHLAHGVQRLHCVPDAGDDLVLLPRLLLDLAPLLLCSQTGRAVCWWGHV